MQPTEKIHHDPKHAWCHTHKRKMMGNPGLDLPWPGSSMVGQFSGPFGSSFTVVGSLRVLVYSGRVPSTPPRVPSGPHLDWSGPTPRLGFTKILQWGRGGGGTLSSRRGGSNIVVQTLLQTGICLSNHKLLTIQNAHTATCTHTHTQND